MVRWPPRSEGPFGKPTSGKQVGTAMTKREASRHNSGNILDNIPPNLPSEVSEDILAGKGVRIERIVSKGHTTDDTLGEGKWYSQDEDEWIILLKGEGEIVFQDEGRRNKDPKGDEGSLRLKEGDYLYIPRGTKHRVSWTTPDETTVWLAIFFQG